MYDCWNEALHYLMNKYGVIKLKTTSWERNKQIDKVVETYDNSNITSHEDKWIVSQMSAYYLSINVKKELYYRLIDMGIIKENLETSN